MRRILAIGAMACLSTMLCSASDLAEARRIVGAQPDKALSIAREALATDPHSIEAHVVAIKALKILGRADEAIAPLEAWSSEAPDAYPPLLMLFDLRAGMKDWTAIANLAARAPQLSEPDRRKFLQAIVLAQLENERFSDAVAALAICPAPVADDPRADLFTALAANATGDWGSGALGRFLTSGVDEDTQTRVLWWTAELQRLSDASSSGAKKSPEVAGGVVKDVRDDTVPTRPIGEVVLPVRKRHVEPRYPEEARAARLEGKVTVQTTVLATGHVAFPTVLASTNPIFNEAARKAVVGWRYEPARQNGKPVAVFYTMVVKFALGPNSTLDRQRKSGSR